MTIKRVIIAIKVKPWGVFLPFVGEHDQSTHCSMQRLLWVFGLMKLAAHESHPISNSQCLSLLSWRSSSYHSFRHNHHHHWVYVITVIMSTGFIIVVTRGTIITSLISPSWSVPSFWSLSFALTFTVAIICYRCRRCHMIITNIILRFIIVIVCIFIITSTMYCQGGTFVVNWCSHQSVCRPWLHCLLYRQFRDYHQCHTVITLCQYD